MNYNDKFNEIKKLFKMWLQRITPLGRVAVFLILSKLIHLWILLPNPVEVFVDERKNVFGLIGTESEAELAGKLR